MTTYVQKSALVACCACIALASGCGKDEKTISTPQGDVTITKKGGGASVEVATKEGKLNIASNDKGVALPANFPKDVPIIKGGVVTVAMTSGDNLNVQVRAPAPVAEVAKYYEDSLKAQGWQIEATMNMGESVMVSAKKGKRQCVVTTAKDGNGSMVQLMVPGEKG